MTNTAGTGVPTGTQAGSPPAAGPAAEPRGRDAYSGAGIGRGAIAAALLASSDQADQDQARQAQASPTVGRFSTPPAPNQNAGAGNEDVWVTVPVDKVQVANGKGTATPVYAQTKGYASPQAGNTIPPTVAAPKTGR